MSKPLGFEVTGQKKATLADFKIPDGRVLRYPRPATFDAAICPECGGGVTTFDSRPHVSFGPCQRHRRLRCFKCNYRFATVEVNEEAFLSILEAFIATTELVEQMRRSADIVEIAIRGDSK